MAATGMYPGLGLPLYLASANPQEPVYPVDPVIENDDFSIGVAVNAGMTTTINALFDDVPTTSAFEVYFDIKPDFANEYVLDTVAAVALQTLYTWTTDGILDLVGFLRIKNIGTADINEAYLQQRATTA